MGPVDPARFGRLTRKLTIPGSWMPLVLIALFLAGRHAISALLAVQPEWRHSMSFMLAACFAYGIASGVFVARTARLLRIVKTATARFG